MIAGSEAWKTEEVFTRERGLNPLSPVAFGGKIYHNGQILKITDGQPLKEVDARRQLRNLDYEAVSRLAQAPLSRHLMLVGGGRVYGFDTGWRPKDAKTALVTVYDLEGNSLGWNTVTLPPESDLAMKKVIDQGIDARSFSYACPFGLGKSALYLRGTSHLWCFGEK